MTDENDVTTDVAGLIQQRIVGFCEEFSKHQTAINDLKLEQKAGLEALVKQFESLDKKTIRKMAVTKHKNNFAQVFTGDEAFHAEYTKVFGIPPELKAQTNE